VIPPMRWAVWLTEEQRHELLHQCEQAAANNTDPVFVSAVEQVREANSKKWITGRLIRGHVTGLRMPHDAIPVRLSEAEASALCSALVLSEQLRRLLDPTQ
jgi:hypothetical protein